MDHQEIDELLQIKFEDPLHIKNEPLDSEDTKYNVKLLADNVLKFSKIGEKLVSNSPKKVQKRKLSLKSAKSDKVKVFKKAEVLWSKIQELKDENEKLKGLEQRYKKGKRWWKQNLAEKDKEIEKLRTEKSKELEKLENDLKEKSQKIDDMQKTIKRLGKEKKQMDVLLEVNESKYQYSLQDERLSKENIIQDNMSIQEQSKTLSKEIIDLRGNYIKKCIENEHLTQENVELKDKFAKKCTESENVNQENLTLKGKYGKKCIENENLKTTVDRLTYGKSVTDSITDKKQRLSKILTANGSTESVNCELQLEITSLRRELDTVAKEKEDLKCQIDALHHYVRRHVCGQVQASEKV